MKDLLTHITDAFGRLGVSEVQIGSTVITVDPPLQMSKLEGFGDTLQVGYVFSHLDSGMKKYPYVVEAILPPTNEGESPTVLSRRIDDGPLQKYNWGPTSFNVFGDGWQRSFKCLSQADVDRWFEETKGPRPDGWNKHPDMTGVEFRTLAGVPVEVKCGSATFKHAAEEIGRVTGYDLKLSGRFSDKAARIMRVAKATRRKPPQVPV